MTYPLNDGDAEAMIAGSHHLADLHRKRGSPDDARPEWLALQMAAIVAGGCEQYSWPLQSSTFTNVLSECRR
jgi:hypothetical protein